MIPPGFLQAILENPQDDSARLIAADWLEENGQDRYADFIRVQIEIEKRVVENDRQDEWEALMVAQSELFDGLTPGHFRFYDGKFSFAIYDFNDAERIYPHGLIRRGFIESVSLPLSSWLQHGPEIVRCQPVEKVTDANIYPSHGVFANAETVEPRYRGVRFFTWSPPRDNAWSSDMVPWEIYRLLESQMGPPHKYYHTESAAIDDLSHACLAWAKSSKSENALALGQQIPGGSVCLDS